MSAIEGRMAAVIAKHQRRIDCNHPAYGQCYCGFNPENHETLQPWDAQAEHVAAVLRAELGLAQEWCARHESGGGFGGWGNAEDARRFLSESAERPPGVDDPGSGRYIGLESRYVTAWEAQ